MSNVVTFSPSGPKLTLPSAVLGAMAGFLQREHDVQAALMGDEFKAVEIDPEEVRRLVANLRAASEWLGRANL